MDGLKQKNELFYIYQTGEIPNEEAIKEQLKYFASFGKQLEHVLELKRAYPIFAQIKSIHKFIFFMFKRKCLINVKKIFAKDDGDEIVDFCVEKCKILEDYFPEASQAFEKRLVDDMELNK